MYNLIDSDFEQMAYNPKKVPKGKLFWEYYQAFNPKKNKNLYGLCTTSAKSGANVVDEGYLLVEEVLEKVFVFIVLFVDSQSPFANETDFDARKRAVLLYLEYTSEKYKTNNHIQKALKVINPKKDDEQSPVFEKLIHIYFLYLNNYDYESWISYKILFHRYTNYLRVDFSPNNNGDIRADAEGRIKIAKEMPNLQAMIEELEVKLFKDERLKAKILEKALEDGYAGYAEKNAENLPFI